MSTQPSIRVIDHSRPDPALIELAAETLRNRGIIVAPTETKYGLLGSMDDYDTLKRIFDLKKREIILATAIFVPDRDAIKRYAVETEISKELTNAFLPGPITLILRAKAPYGPPIVVDGKIGIRISSSPVISAILKKIEFGLTATSANLSGECESETVSEISDLFGSRVDLYLDAGPLAGKPSTVIDCCGDEYRIVRKGAIRESEIVRCLERVR